MSSVNKKQEDKNLMILRELLTFENNRFCFDCDQRGPTYVNITIGSFVCTNCGGALRKYSHRVKSISMSNFNQVEMDFMKKRGNNICKKIYYGLCDSHAPPEMDIKNGGLDSHLRAKYELKKWYLEPTAEFERESINQNQTIFDRVEKGAPKAQKGCPINSSSNMIIEPPKLSGNKAGSTKGSRVSIDVAENSLNTSSQRKSSSDIGSIDPAKLGGGSAVRLPMPGDNKIINWPSNTAVQVNQPAQSPFGDDFIFSSSKESSTNATLIPKSQTINFSVPPLLPVQQATPNNNISTSQVHQRPQLGSDKYAALAELDDLFSSTNITSKQAAPPSASQSVIYAPTWDSTAPQHDYPWHNPVTPYTATPSNVITSNPFSAGTYPAAPTPFNPFVQPTWPGSAVQAPHPSANPFLNSTNVNSKNPFL